MALLLENTWNAWYDYSTPGRTAKDYEKGLYSLCTVNSIEDFWGYYNNLPCLESLEDKCGFHFMVDGVSPTWEDEANRNGGIWKIRVRGSDAQELWKEILISLIGDEFKDHVSTRINGFSVVKRSGYYIFTIWVRDDVFCKEITQYFLGLVPNVAVTSGPRYQRCAVMLKNYS